MKYTEYTLDSIDQIPEKRGIYSWHIKHVDGIELKQYFSIYRNKKLSSEVKGVFNENYSGQLKLSPEFDTSKFDITTMNTISDLTKFLNTPIYIGISDNLNRRLKQHCEKLLSSIFDPTYPSYSLEWDNRNEDTEEESSYFAERIGSVLTENKIKAINILFVRVYELEIERKNLLQVEKFFNQCLLPIFGKR